MNFLAAIGQHEQERVRCAATRQIVEEFQAGIVTPVQILYDEQERRGVGLTGEGMGQTSKEAAAVLLSIQRREQWVLCGLGKQIGEQGKESGSERTQSSDGARSGIGCQQRTQEVEQRGIGTAPIRGKAAPLQNLETLCRGN